MQALDLLEELRPLHASESTLRRLAAQNIQAVNNERLTFWRQRFHIKIATEWDESSRFFHTCASGRRRKNLIHCLEHDGQSFLSHDAKGLILHNFYSDLLGRARAVEWRFTLSELYPTTAVSGMDLSRPFSLEEISSALYSMDMNASPGPDGFGPSFYKKFWSGLRDRVLHLFEQFYDGSLDLDCLNRAHLVLIPKKENSRTADAFRPISLQNCPMKLFTKVW